MIKYKQLQERISYFLATIDSEITDDGAFVEKRQTIVFNKDSYRIKYKKINMKFRFFAELETYRYEPLESMYINIHNGFLTKALFKGKKTDVNIIFEYQDGKLKKEKIFNHYYQKKSGNISITINSTRSNNINLFIVKDKGHLIIFHFAIPPIFF